MAVNKKKLPVKRTSAKAEPPPPEVEIALVVNVAPLVPEGHLCDCGKPVAKGQTSVCKDHIRTN